MSLYEPGELEEARADFARELFTQSAKLSRRRSGLDAGGSGNGQWVVVDTVPGRLRRAGVPRQVVTAEQLAYPCEWTWVCAPGTDIQENDRLAVDGRLLEVRGTDAGRADQVTLQVFCSESLSD